MAEIILAAADGICMGNRGRSEKNLLEAPLRVLLDSTIDMGILLGIDCDSSVDM